MAAVRAVIESGGEAVTVPDSAILDALSELARTAAVFSEPAAATAWACARQAAKQGIIGKHESVACLLTGNGLKDVASARKIVRDPTLIEPTFEAAEKALQDMR
jgi:threonine synthase